jgi:hypothetical protein
MNILRNSISIIINLMDYNYIYIGGAGNLIKQLVAKKLVENFAEEVETESPQTCSSLNKLGQV